MRKIDPRFAPFAWIFVYPILTLIQFGSRVDLRELGTAGFWLDFGRVILLGAAGAGFVAGSLYSYYRFCRWFDRTIEAKRARIALRVAARDGDMTWPASDPLHDPEIDG